MTTIVRSKGGTAERQVDIGEIVVPDLWHIARAIEQKLSKEMASEILDCWHLAHDLKRHIEGQ